MKISNFRFTERTGSDELDWKFKAIVTVETGRIFKNKVDKEIYKEYAGNWYFTDTGDYTPRGQVEKLERKFEASVGSDLEDYIFKIGK